MATLTASDERTRSISRTRPAERRRKTLAPRAYYWFVWPAVMSGMKR